MAADQSQRAIGLNSVSSDVTKTTIAPGPEGGADPAMTEASAPSRPTRYPPSEVIANSESTATTAATDAKAETPGLSQIPC